MRSASSGLAGAGLLVAAGGLGALIAMQRFGVRAKPAYILPALVVWGGIYAAGIHPTIAGVLVGLLTPVRAWLGPAGFVAGVRHELKHLEESPNDTLSTHSLAGRLRQVDVARREALSPAEGLIASLHPWVAFLIMPVFALANAGVSLGGGALEGHSWRVVAGIVVGLVVGKPCGVLIACWLVLRLGLGRLPAGIGLRHLLVLGSVAGVGFTMALFVAQLAFPSEELLRPAKLAVLSASAIAGVLALLLGRILLFPVAPPGTAMTADEAERSTEA